MREWTTLFVEGKSIYEVAEESAMELTPEQLMEFERQALLNEADLHEYRVGHFCFQDSHKSSSITCSSTVCVIQTPSRSHATPNWPRFCHFDLPLS